MMEAVGEIAKEMLPTARAAEMVLAAVEAGKLYETTHPVFVDGVVRYDLEEAPAAWGKLSPRSVPSLDPALAETVLAPVRHLAVYGSEVGRPCDCLFCGD